MGLRMRIAFLYDALYPEVKGGVERRLYELGKRLSKRHEVHWYTFGWWGGGRVIERDGMIIHSLGKPVPLYNEGIRNPSEAVVFSVRTLLAHFNEFDVLDFQEFPYLPAYFLRMKVPPDNLVITWHEFWGDYWREYLPLGSDLGFKVEEGLLKLSKYHISVSRHTLHRMLGSRSVNVKVIPNGIDFKAISSVKGREDVHYDAVFVGRLVTHKNVPLFLRSLRLILREVPDFKVAVIGDGPQKTELLSLAKKLGVSSNVDFLGFLEDFNDVIAIMKSSSVFALPSVREGFGLVVLEANASGLPVVTVRSPLNASVELIHEGKNGYVSENTPSTFAGKLLLAWETSRRMGRTSVNIAKRYDWDKIARKLEKYYEGVIDGT